MARLQTRPNQMNESPNRCSEPFGVAELRVVRRFLPCPVNREFQPGIKPDRNRLVGSWQETGWREIALPFTASNLTILLQQAATLRRSDFIHKDIAHWGDCYGMAARMGEFRQSSDAIDRQGDQHRRGRICAVGPVSRQHVLPATASGPELHRG